MNRRDAAMIAHLDSIESRILAAVREMGTEIRSDIRQLREEIANLKLELATHRHEEES